MEVLMANGAMLMTAITIWGALATSHAPDAPLFAGITDAGGHEQRAQLVQHRIEGKYKLGQREAGLADYLSSQGMKIVKRTTSSEAPGQPIYGEARLTYGPATCKMLVSVFWRGDSRGLLTELRANHDTDRCL